MKIKIKISIAKREKIEKLIYDSTFKLNDTRIEIWRKTHKLNRCHAQMIQLISGSRAFHFVILKMKFGIQEVISPYSLNKILLSNTTWTQKSI